MWFLFSSHKYIIVTFVIGETKDFVMIRVCSSATYISYFWHFCIFLDPLGLRFYISGFLLKTTSTAISVNESVACNKF